MRTLVIEDDPALRRVLTRGLTEEGFVVDSAHDGELGADLARTNDYDAIVLDLMLPKIPGLAVLRGIRRAGRATPVIILTARDGSPDKVAGLDAGADDYLTKPFRFEELSARLRALIRRANRNWNAVIEVADLRVDTAARQVTRAGRPIELRAKEYALLELLALRRGRIVTRAEIHCRLYPMDDESLSNVVEVHVYRLRAAIDRDFTPALLHTVRGQGYRLGGP